MFICSASRRNRFVNLNAQWPSFHRGFQISSNRTNQQSSIPLSFDCNRGILDNSSDPAWKVNIAREEKAANCETLNMERYS